MPDNSSTLYYFGYGSNLFVPRITARIASSKTVATAAIPGYQLRFNINGHDGSAKANMWCTENPDDLIRGAIYAMDAAQKPLLDEIEGGYTPRDISLLSDAGEALEVFVYIADQWLVDATVKPYSWYRDLVLHGARSHNFPDNYCAAIAAVAAKDDPDAERDRVNRYGIL